MKLASQTTTIGTWALAIKRTLDARGVNGDKLLREAGIDVSVCGDPNTRLPSPKLNKLWDLAERATGDPRFGLSVPMFVHATTLHAMTMANFAATSLYDAFSRSARFSRIITTTMQFALNKQDGVYQIEYLLTEPNSLSHHGVEASMLLCVRMAREIDLNPENKPIAVHLKRREDNDRDFFEQAFGCPVHFESERWFIEMDAAQVEAPLPTANPEILQSCERIMAEYLARMDKADISHRVYQLILELLVAGEPSQERVADALHMSTRSLHRKLTAAGTNFKSLLDNTRRELAMQYIRQSNLSIADITYNLGFYDASSFSRAFKRWTGMSPAKYRRDIALNSPIEHE
ncbi:AraC family transcriptional regulator [Umboniibacter marinipuniceus]|uniref:AraC family transcriptional regulator n=1 Tax=Umboniibacter marinipuniceus TaxID=569599 RepID=A0A3M0ABS3_9GAMM|nr:AraC family transcriptional regulator [Umboniibacter marinipuniceus]RMA82350.1 AraC family transcriptional regulator [Umboniibacter marinipuniceus]